MTSFADKTAPFGVLSTPPSTSSAWQTVPLGWYLNPTGRSREAQLHDGARHFSGRGLVPGVRESRIVALSFDGP